MRRGVRAAIGVPVSALLALWLVPRSPAGIIAAFGALCLIAICDFGGPPRRRLLSLLGAGVVGGVLITIGILASQSIVPAVVVTLVVGAAIAYSPVLRGSVASGAPAMSIMYVVAITAGLPASDVPKAMLAWALSVAVAIPLTLFVLPRRGLVPVRAGCSTALRAFADAVEARARGEQPDVEALASAQDALRHSYLGNPFRAAGLSTRDRSLVALAGQLQGLLATVMQGRAYPTPLPSEPITLRLVERSAQALRDAADALGSERAVAPSGLAIVEDWRAQWDTAVGIVREAHTDGVERVSELFPDRTMGVATVRVVMLVRRVLGLPDEQYPTGPDIPAIPAPAVSSGRDDLRAEATLRSPWARLALRTGIGLALAVLVVQITGLAHGLWVVLGVTSVLRFDGLTTMKTAAFAILGTFGGAAVGYALLASDPDAEVWLWVALVVATFLAVWVPAAVGFALGQAAFSIFVILAFTVMTWPPDLATATDRFEDVAVGAVVSIVVAMLLWPGGVLAGLIANVSDAVRSTTALLRESIVSLVEGDAVSEARIAESARAMARSQEVVELSLSSPSAQAAQVAYQWQALIDHLRMPAVAGRLLSGWAQRRQPIATAAPSLEAPLMAELDVVSSEWSGVADQIDGGPQRAPVADPGTLAALGAATAGLEVSDPEVADRVVAAVWAHGWLRMSLEAGRACEVPAPR